MASPLPDYAPSRSRLKKKLDKIRRMECEEKQRLTEEYFDALKRQQWIRERLEPIKAEGDAQTIAVAEKQAEAATEECYDAWRAMNEHECVATCKRG